MTMTKISTAIFLAVNLMFFTLSSACEDCDNCVDCPIECDNCPKPPPPPSDDCPGGCDGLMPWLPPPPPPSCDDCPGGCFSCLPGCDGCSQPSPPPPPSLGCEDPPPPPPPSLGCEDPPPPPPDVTASPKCPTDIQKFEVCGDYVRGFGGDECCNLFNDLSDVEAADCACGALKAKAAIGIEVDLHAFVGLFLKACSKTVPADCQCD